MDYAVFVAGILLWLTASLCVRTRRGGARVRRCSWLPAVAVPLGAALLLEAYTRNLGSTALLSLLGSTLCLGSLAGFAGPLAAQAVIPRVQRRLARVLFWGLPLPVIGVSLAWPGGWLAGAPALLGLLAAVWVWRAHGVACGGLHRLERAGLASVALAGGCCALIWQDVPAGLVPLAWVSNAGRIAALAGSAMLLVDTYRQEARRDGASLPLRGWGVPLFLFAFLALGYAITGVQGFRAGNEMSSTLRDRTAALAGRLDPEIVRKLEFSAADEGTPAYARLRQQLIDLGRLYPSRSLYTMKFRDGAFYFGPDNLPPGDPMTGPPGILYRNPPAALLRDMHLGKPIMAGPYLDEYGHFLSCFAPVFDPRSREVIAFVGQDVSEEVLARMIAVARLIPMLGILLVLLVLIASWHLFKWRAAQGGERRRWLRHTELALTLLTGLMLTLGLAYTSLEYERHERHAQFRQTAETGADAVFGEFFDVRRDLATLAGYFEGSSHVTAEEFQAFSQALVRVTSVDFYAWVPVVPSRARAAVESKASAESGRPWQIWEDGGPAGPRPAADRPVYYPVRYSTSNALEPPLQGLDLGVLPVCAATLQDAIAGGLCTATSSFRFLQPGVQSPSIAVLHPVYTRINGPDGGRNVLLGLVAAVVHLPELLDRALDATSVRQGGLRAALVDYSKGMAPEVLATYQLEHDGLSHWLLASPSYLPPDVYADPVPIFGRAYAFLALPGTDLWRYALLGRTGLIVVGGLLLTGLLAGFVTYTRLEKTRLEAQVQTRTEALRASEETFRQLVESSADAISLIREGRFVDCNTATARFLGVEDKASIISKTPFDISPAFQPDGRASDEKAAAMIRMAEEAGHHSFDWLHTRADGSTMLVEVMLTPVTVRGARMLMAVWRDITERYKAQEAQLAMERHMLERQKLESLGILAGGIAHDFNNILMAIQGYAELAIEQAATGSSLHEDLRQIMAAARRAADLCAQMLAYTGKGALTRQPVALYTLIQEMNDLLRLSISKKVHLDIALSDVPPVVGDASQLGQVVLNLILNAAEAMEGHEGTVNVGLSEWTAEGTLLPPHYFEREIPPGSYALLTVKDSGCGMDEATRKRIFEPFFTTKFTGRGLGLAAVLGIVQAHHGTMGLETAPGAGTTFYVLLPTEAAAVPAGAAAPKMEATPVPLDRACILLVDDEPQVLAVAAKTLGRAGYDVLTAEGGREAVECFRGRPNDIALVILDLTMPDIDGLEAVPLLRAINPYVRVLLSSGFSREDVSARLGEETIQGVLQKPYTRRDLLEMVARILEG